MITYFKYVQRPKVCLILLSIAAIQGLKNGRLKNPNSFHECKNNPIYDDIGGVFTQVRKLEFPIHHFLSFWINILVWYKNNKKNSKIISHARLDNLAQQVYYYAIHTRMIILLQKSVCKH